MTAAIARIRKDVEIANYEDQLTSIRESFKRKYKKHEVEKAMKSVD